jgi:hypothetical protein
MLRQRCSIGETADHAPQCACSQWLGLEGLFTFTLGVISHKFCELVCGIGKRLLSAVGVNNLKRQTCQQRCRELAFADSEIRTSGLCLAIDRK